MKWVSTLLALLTVAHAATAQSPILFPDDPAPAAGYTADHRFPNFIGFLSDPTHSIDPRSLNQIWPVFLGNRVSPAAPFPAGDLQVYGAGFNLALSDRLSIVANQGGYATSHFGGRVRERDRGLFPA